MTPGQTDVFEILELVTLEGLVPGQREFVSIKADYAQEPARS